jgi:hypothetical protein
MFGGKLMLISTAFSVNRVETFLSAIVNNNNLSLLLLNDDHLEVFAPNNQNTGSLAHQPKLNTIEHPNSTLPPLKRQYAASKMQWIANS